MKRTEESAGSVPLSAFHDDAQTVARLDSVSCLLEWMRSLPEPNRKRFWSALIECSDTVQKAVVTLLPVVKDPHTTPVERQRALTTLADALFLSPDKRGEESGQERAASDSRETKFAQRLQELMEAKRISQQELAARVGCSQPAISQMLQRRCRPQKKTILKLAEALNVQACELWPDLEVAEMLDAVAGFQQDDYVMTEAEARALADPSNKNRSKVRVKALPKRAAR
jgi:transcriptional regulator with XRE-family HTH domain